MTFVPDYVYVKICEWENIFQSDGYVSLGDWHKVFYQCAERCWVKGRGLRQTVWPAGRPKGHLMINRAVRVEVSGEVLFTSRSWFELLQTGSPLVVFTVSLNISTVYSMLTKHDWHTLSLLKDIFKLMSYIFYILYYIMFPNL